MITLKSQVNTWKLFCLLLFCFIGIFITLILKKFDLDLNRQDRIKRKK